MKQLSEEQIAEYKEAFNLFDKNGDGTISEAELKGVMESLGYKPTSKELQDMMHEVDIDNNGTIEFDEFVELMQRRVGGSSDPDGEFKEAFKIFDKDGDGRISEKELKEVMTQLGEKMSDQDVTDMIKEADQDKDGYISFTEFLRMLKGK